MRWSLVVGLLLVSQTVYGVGITTDDDRAAAVDKATEDEAACSDGLPTDLHAPRVHARLERCLEEYADGQLVALYRDLKSRFTTATAQKGRILFTYFLDERGTPLFSIKEYRNGSGLYTYFRRGSGDDSTTFVSRRVFLDESSGQLLKYFRKRASNDSTFLSRKAFANQNGRYTYWRRGFDDDSESFFTVREFSVGDESHVYYRSSNHDDSTFASLKYKETAEGRHSEFRLGYGTNARTFLTINGDHFRDGQNRRISSEQARLLLDALLWQPLAMQSFATVKTLLDQTLSAVEPPSKK